jgi:hypothetical protein
MNRVRCFQFLASCLLVLSWAVPGFGEQHNPCISEWEIQVKKEPLLVLGNLPDGGKYKLGETVTVDGDLFVVPGLQHEVDVKCGKPPRAEKALIPADIKVDWIAFGGDDLQYQGDGEVAVFVPEAPGTYEVRFFAKGTYTVDSEDGEGTPIEIEGVSEVNTFVTVECVPNYRYQEELPASFVVSPIQAPKVAPINKPITLRANFRENPGTRRLHDKSPCKLPPFPEVEPLVIVERTVRWSVTQPNGVVLRRTGEVLTFTPSLPGDYEVSFSVQGKALLEEGDEEEGEEDILVLVAQINSDLSKITVVRARLMLEVIPQDNRDTTLFQTLEQGTPAFAGSEPKSQAPD